VTLLPFGVERLDDVLGGGVPPGNSVLVATESGAGGREFAYTSAAMNALAGTDPELFDLYYGELDEAARQPAEVHYLSLSAGEAYVERELRYVMADEIVDAAVDDIQFRDFSEEYFQLSSIPREWYVGEATSLRDLSGGEDREEVLSALGEYLSAHASGNLIVLDSLTELVDAAGGEISWDDVAMLARGLGKAAHSWGCLLLAIVNVDTLSEIEYGQLMDASGGTLEYRWESGGSQRARTMVVREFRGVLSQLEEENIVQFETEIHDGGFDISDVRKIR